MNKQGALQKKAEELLESETNKKQDLIESKPYFYSTDLMTKEEVDRFSREDSEDVPVVLEGDSTDETLKAYLTQAFLYMPKGMGDQDMMEDGVAMAIPEMAMDDSAMSVTSTAMPMMRMAVNTTAVMSKSATANAAAPPMAEMAPGGDMGGSGAQDFSGTNVQVKGVDEGDIWKYDGEKFYVLSKSQNNYYPTMMEPMMTTMVSEPRGLPSKEMVGVSVDRAVEMDVDSDEGFAAGEDMAEFSENKMIDCYRCKPEESGGKLRIVTKEGKTVSETHLGNLNASEIYLYNDRVALVGNQQPSRGGWMDFSHWQSGVINTVVMDVSNPEAPKSALDIKFQGYLIRSRRVDDQLYIISRFTPQIASINYYPRNKLQMEANKKAIESLALSELLPAITINGEKKTLIKPDQCWLTVMQKSQWGSPTLTLITKISLETGEYQSRCIGGNVEGIYMSQNALYLYNTSYLNYENTNRAGVIWNWQEGNTHIHKFVLDTLSYAGSQLVDGLVGYNNASFRFGELKDGSLGIVTTKNEWRKPEHRLTVLGDSDGKWTFKAMLPNPEQPKVIGKPGERIYSVRFMQDRAYLVTFQKTDPLYVIDLSDPGKPKITGELEIPGFSDYLHPVGNDKLLGIGKASKTGMNGVSYYQGVKVSLFDVGDITDPRELGYKIIGQRGSSTPLASNHLAFAGIQQENSYRFAFPVSVNEGYSSYNYNRDSAGIYHDWKHTGLYLFEIKDNSLQAAGALITDKSNENNGFGGWQERRGLIQGDAVYHLKGDRIYSADWYNAASHKGPF